MQGNAEISPQTSDTGDIQGLNRVIYRVVFQAERARLVLVRGVERLVETLRLSLLSHQRRPIDDYDEPRSEISAFLKSCRRIFWALAAFSGLSNLLMLTGSFFMLQVYDRVLPGRSIPTLVALMALATVLYMFQGGLDLVRSRVSARIGRYFDERLGHRVFDALVRLPLKTRGDGDGLQPLRDLDQVRSFLSGGGPTALFDLPWMPIYLAICFLFHFWIGVTALIGATVLIAITTLTETRTQGPAKASSRLGVSRSALAVEGRRNAEVLQAMGMRGQAVLRWQEINGKYLAAHERASDVANGLGGLSKVFRSILQSLVLAVGAVLVINQEFDGGHHHRRINPDIAGARPGGSSDRELEGIHRSTSIGISAGSTAAAAPRRGGATRSAAADQGARRRSAACRRTEFGKTDPQ